MSEKFNIDITPGEALDFDLQLSEKESAELKKSVFTRITEIQKAEEQENRRKRVISFRRRVLSLVAAAVLMIASTTAIATITKQKIVTEKPPKAVQQKAVTPTEKETVTVMHTVATSLPAEVTKPVKKERKYVNLYSDIIDGYTLIDKKDGWYAFEHRDGYNSKLNFDCQIIYCDTGWSRDYIVEAANELKPENMPEFQQFFIDDRKAMYVNYKPEGIYTQQLFVQYRESGYILSILGAEGLDSDSFIELGKKIRLESCQEAQAVEYISLTKYFENYNPDKLTETAPLRPVEEVLLTEGQTVEVDGCQITMESITAYDNISEFTSATEPATEATSETEETTETQQETAEFNRILADSLDMFTSEDGTFPVYNRKVIHKGDGIFMPEEKVIAQQETVQSFCLVQLSIKNTNDFTLENFSTAFPLVYIQEYKGSYYYDDTCYSRPFTIEMCQEDNLPKYYSHNNGVLSLEPQQELTIQLGYFTDADSHCRVGVPRP